MSTFTDGFPDRVEARLGANVHSPARRELVNWFTHAAPSLAFAYQGALRMLADPSFPGRLHFISHAIRDIADRLPFVLDGELRSNRVPYENRLDKVLGIWQFDRAAETFDGSARTTDDSPTIAIPRQAYRELNVLIHEHAQRRERPDNFQLLFQSLMRHDASNGVTSERLVAIFKKEVQWFKEKAHLPSNVVRQIEDGELVRRFERFEKCLHSFVGQFFTAASPLDDILRETNKPTA